MATIAKLPRSGLSAWLFAGSALVFSGCAAHPAQVGPLKPPSALAAAEELPPLGGASPSEGAPALAQRHVGDLSVHRFFGSYAKQPLLLSERVIAREDDVWVVEYELEQGDSVERMRVRRSVRSDRITQVSRMLGDREVPAAIRDYEEWLARTSFIPDRNAGPTGESAETCLVGPREFECQVAHYKVFVDEREASLTVKKSQRLGRDLSGEIVALDGTVIYGAELIEQASGAEAASASARASAE